MERLIPNSLTGTPDPGYLRNLTEQVNYITSRGAYAMIQPHNYGRYYKEVITDANAFGKWWQTVATQYKDNSRVIWDTNNEYVGQAGKPTLEADRADTDTTPCPLNWLSL